MVGRSASPRRWPSARKLVCALQSRLSTATVWRFPQQDSNGGSGAGGADPADLSAPELVVVGAGPGPGGAGGWPEPMAVAAAWASRLISPLPPGQELWDGLPKGVALTVDPDPQQL